MQHYVKPEAKVYVMVNVAATSVDAPTQIPQDSKPIELPDVPF